MLAKIIPEVRNVITVNGHVYCIPWFQTAHGPDIPQGHVPARPGLTRTILQETGRSFTNTPETHRARQRAVWIPIPDQ